LLHRWTSWSISARGRSKVAAAASASITCSFTLRLHALVDFLLDVVAHFALQALHVAVSTPSWRAKSASTAGSFGSDT
jgi:hypothetical protein